jgi:hypothetical protein
MSTRWHTGTFPKLLTLARFAWARIVRVLRALERCGRGAVKIGELGQKQAVKGQF